MKHLLPVLFSLIASSILISTATCQTDTDDLSIAKQLQPISPASFFKTDGYYNWCPSIIKDKDGLYHLFYSRWKKKYSFNGWLPLSEIAHATAPTATGPWTFKETVLTGRGKGHWDAIEAHNPKIKYFNGRYYLYYIGTHYNGKRFTHKNLLEIAQAGSKHKDWMLLRNNQRTGVAVASSLNGPWKRSDAPIVQPSGPITRLTVNPAITEGPDGRYYMIVKGDKPGEKRFIRNEAVAISSSPEGPFEVQPEPVIDYLDTEDVSMWYDNKRKRFYGIFHTTQDFLGMVTSADGIHWKKAHEYIITNKELVMADGGIFKPQKMERPFVWTEEDEPRVLSVAVKQDDETFLVFVKLKEAEKPNDNDLQ
ncbi:MAG: glycoside hydrolase family protein [Agriterribacter sp.]